MKKIHFFLVFNLMFLSLNAQNTYIPDVGFEQALIHLGIDKDGIINNSVATSDISSVTNLDLSGRYNIKDLTGIEDFKSLYKLTIRQKDIISLDLSGNTALVNLYCEGNKLTNINVTQCPDLEWISCSANELTSIDVSNNTKLQRLWCMKNKLKNIDVSNNIELFQLRCYDNLLTDIKVANAFALVELKCYNNELENLDVSGLTNLQYLSCQNNKLASLNISSNKALKSLRCDNNSIELIDVSNNIALTALFIESNQIEVLDLSKNTTLEYLSCKDNKLTSLDLSKNKALSELNCSNNTLTSLDLRNSVNSPYNKFDFTSNPSLTCIFVDNPDEANKYYNWKKDRTSFYKRSSCNFVELSADTLNISETGGESIITATLTDGTTTGDVKINLSFSGTADPLSYECLASITIPEGQTSASVKLTTKKFDNDSDKTVKVSIESIIHFDIREFGKQQFTILINNENDAPTNISLEESFFEEHINKSLLTKIIVDDVDDLTHLVTLIEGDGSDDNDQFRVVNSILYKNIVFDFEIKNTYSIRVKAEDPEGLSIEKVLIITIIDIEDFPTDITLNSSSFNESSTISHLANFIVEDKPGKTHNITLIDGHDSDDNDDFSITGTSLIRNIDFDYESKKEYKIRVKAEDSGGFFIEKSFILTIINFNDIEIDGDIVNPFCSSDDTGSISITVQQAIPPLAYSWSSGETTANISGKTVGTYSLTVTDAENMIKTKEFVIESPLIYSDLSICYITSDDTSPNNNRIYFNAENAYNLDKIHVLREGNVAGYYDVIAEIDSDESSYLDSSSDNQTQSYNYVVRVKDKCGNISEVSAYHKTVLLQANNAADGSVNLNWSAYEGLNFGTYDIYRQIDNEAYILLKSLSSGNLNYNDRNASTGSNSYSYYIGITVNQSCDFTSNIFNKKGPTDMLIKSNIKVLSPSLGIDDKLLSEGLSFYPNPVKNILSLESKIPIEKVEILSSLGKKEIEVYSGFNSIRTDNLPKGIYILKIYSEKATTVRKIIKQ